MASDKLLKDSVDSIVALDVAMLPLNSEEKHYFFTAEDIESIKSKVRAYQANNNSREGGAYLIKELQLVHNFKESLFTHLENIRQALKPREVTRTTVKEAEALATERSIRAVALTLEHQEEKLLRQLAQMFIGDSHLDYTKEELPMLIAHKQITGEVLAVGRVH